MYNVILYSSLLAITAGQGQFFGPTSGYVWPMPFFETKQQIALEVDPVKEYFKVSGNNCKLVQKAVYRCKEYIETLSKLIKKYGVKDEKELLVIDIQTRLDAKNISLGEPQLTRGINNLNEIQIMMNEPCEEYPHDKMDESYSLNISDKAMLKSNSVWGIIRGLETLSQLFYVTTDFKAIKINVTMIEDKPNYLYRGYMLDTSRHYISVSNILKTLDAMAMNKMNVFHWHIVDDQSFPLVISKFPELSSTAAYHSSMVYNNRDLIYIRDYARDRGIRVIMELDLPGHSNSYRISHPEIMSKCPPGDFSNPINPVKNETYELLKDIFAEVQSIFPDKYLHTGGDEIYEKCWYADPDVKKYMKNHGMNDTVHIRILFYQKMSTLIKNGTVPIFWEDAFYDLYNKNYELPKNSIIQLWKSDYGIIDVLSVGLLAIKSFNYYLNQLSTEFEGYYLDPRAEAKNIVVKESIEFNETLLNNILGGTACMWGELVDDTNMLSQSWPRASAIAENLWSHTKGMNLFVFHRIEEHVCRMRRRGIPAQPATGPGFCVL